MSKQMRKKTSKPAARKTPAAKTKAATKTSTGKSISKPAGKAGKTAASQKVAAKSLRITKPRKLAAPAAEPAVAVAPRAAVARTPAKPKAAAKPAALQAVVADLPAAAAPPAPPVRKPGELAPGDKAPLFALPRDGGDTVSLADYSGRKLVIFFYPRADTPGCTREAIDFTRLAADFDAAGASVLGVSADSLKAQESFRNKHRLTTPLISDEQHAMLAAYGAWGEKSMYGRTFQGVLRTTVVIGADGRIARIWRGVKVDGHADAVLALVRTL
jgi:peroxiredoxin Q/BCP